ncbi:MAG TPA: Mur ligase domain-containing protein [Candidatus Saccharimonadales bacterium]|nr:Mur ligase domain-containing protein [Candidatus Saccharimonadales bacterium]
MHIFFSGIGGSGIGPLALIAKQAGFEVSGSDKQRSAYTDQLQHHDIGLHIGQTEHAIARLHAKKPIDWLVYSSSVERENPNHPELLFARAHNIKLSKRDELLNHIIASQNLQLIGIAGTHGKSTTTAMVIWLFRKLRIPIGYSVGAKIPFGPAGQLAPGSTYFVYECDEFDRNFLAFHPVLSVITGLGWDHHEIFPTEDSLKQAFNDFLGQSQHSFMWDSDADWLGAKPQHCSIVAKNNPAIDAITLPGEYNRHDAWLAVQAVQRLTGESTSTLVAHINEFPGLKQRMEQLAPNLYTNYAHTPEKLRGGMITATELAQKNQPIVVIYEPLTNRRQYFIKNLYKNVFAEAHKIYWVPTFLAREDPNQPILTPEQLIPNLTNAHIAEPAELNDQLATAIAHHLKNGHMVVAMGASGNGSLDAWLRQKVKDGALN